MKEEEQVRTGYTDKKQSNREAVHVAMLKESLRQPGVREAMEAYRNWQRADNGLGPYRVATKQPRVTTTKDHANAGDRFLGNPTLSTWVTPGMHLTSAAKLSE